MQLKLEKQVATFAQSIAIHSFGVKHDPIYWWKCKSNNYGIPNHIWLSREKEGYHKLCFPAWTVSELGILLPGKIKTTEDENDLLFFKTEDMFCCEYFQDNGEMQYHEAEDEAILKASVFISLVHNGYILTGGKDEMANIKGRLEMA